MQQEIIPTHHLAAETPAAIRVDHIRKQKKAVQNEVHRHDFHELFFFRSGKGDHMIDLKNYKIKVPCIHLVGPGQVHQLSRSGDTTGSVLMFAGEAPLGLAVPFKRQLFKPNAPTSMLIGREQLNEAIGLLKHIEKELKHAGSLTANSYVGILLMKVAEWRSSSVSSADPMQQWDLVTQFQLLVEERFRTQRQVQTYAKELHISPGHLNELTKKRLGKSASILIQERTLLEAKRSLLHSDLSIKEIAYDLGMDDPAYFTRMFKRLAGVSPQKYRSTIREKYK